MPDRAAYPLRAVPASALPVAQMVIGKPVEEAAALLPCLFNLCRVAQGIAARAAFGLPLHAGWEAELRAEILREHVAKLCLKWPGMLSLPGVALPPDWPGNPAALRRVVFGPKEALPRDWDGFSAWMGDGDGVGAVLRKLSQLFVPGEAVRRALPLATPGRMFGAAHQENSAAARQAGHAVLRAIEARWGRGPFWSAAGLTYDLEAVLEGRLPSPSVSAGLAVVPAARGSYAVRARVETGVVTAFARVTPTDHLLVSGGALDQSLASLPVGREKALAPLLLSVLDPCFPVTLEEIREAAHA